MKVKVLRGVMTRQGRIAAGAIYDGPPGECSDLLGSGRCARYEEPEVETAEESVEIKDADGKPYKAKTEYTAPAGKKVGVRKTKKKAGR